MSFKSVDKLEKKINHLDSIDDINKKTEKYNECKKKIESLKETLEQYLKLRPEVKTLNDYEKVAPTIIKEILLEGLEKAGLPKE